MDAVGRGRSTLQALVAMLCVALAVVFVGASAASVTDDVQHAAQIEHEHGFRLTLSVDGHGEPDHQTHHQRGGDPDAPDHQPDAGHHHSDAPVGALAGVLNSAPLVMAALLEAAAIQAASPKGVRPGGLERPPKAGANLV